MLPLDYYLDGFFLPSTLSDAGFHKAIVAWVKLVYLGEVGSTDGEVLELVELVFKFEGIVLNHNYKWT